MMTRKYFVGPGSDKARLVERMGSRFLGEAVTYDGRKFSGTFDIDEANGTASVAGQKLDLKEIAKVTSSETGEGEGEQEDSGESGASGSQGKKQDGEDKEDEGQEGQDGQGEGEKEKEDKGEGDKKDGEGDKKEDKKEGEDGEKKKRKKKEPKEGDDKGDDKKDGGKDDKQEPPPPSEAVIPADIEKVMKTAIALNKPLLLEGPTGCGKTTCVRELARVCGKPLDRVGLDGESSKSDILGSYVLRNGNTEWQDGMLVRAAKEGRWIVLDETNAALPEVLFVLHSLLDDDHCIILKEKDGEVIVPHPDFRFFCTINPTADYVGTKELNPAFRSRFWAIVNFDYLPAEKEAALIVKKTGVDEKVATWLVANAGEIRKMRAKEQVYFTCSTRDIIQAAEMHKNRIKLEDAFRFSVLNKCTNPEEVKTIEQALKIVPKAKDMPSIADTVKQAQELATLQAQVAQLTAEVQVAHKYKADSSRLQEMLKVIRS